MKTHIKNLLLLPALMAGLGLTLAGRVTAQTFTTLYNFTATPGPDYTNTDGANPQAQLILAGSTLYGTTDAGGSSQNGVLFAVNIHGTGFTNLHNFTATTGVDSTNSDGTRPDGGLILSGNTLYATTFQGGGFGSGTVFKLNTDGSGFTNLHTFTAMSGDLFTNSDGALPYAVLALAGNTLYGAANQGGTWGNGTLFAIHTNSTGFTNLYTFTAGPLPFPLVTNGDGAFPQGRLILSGNTLYGTAEVGGSAANGTVFAVNLDGTGFTNLHNFTARSGSPATNSDGVNPFGLVLWGNMLYGTAGVGGSANRGTVFAVNTNGTGFTNLHSFTALSGAASTNSDGANPRGLILSGNTLYGTAGHGGSSGNGTVFAVNTNGTGFTNLYSFTATSALSETNSDGADPIELILAGDTLYVTARNGGASGNGTVFRLTLSLPRLTAVPDGANVRLVWPTNAFGFNLQSATNLVSPAVWSTNFPAPTIVAGQNVVIDPIAGKQKFYRLSQ